MMPNDHNKVCVVHMFTAGVLRFVEDKEEDADYQYIVGIAVGVLVSGLFNDGEELQAWFVHYLSMREKAGDEFDAKALCNIAEQAVTEAEDYVLVRQGSIFLQESQEDG